MTDKIKNTRRAWSAEDAQWLVENYCKGDLCDVAAHFGINVKTLQTRVAIFREDGYPIPSRHDNAKNAQPVKTQKKKRTTTSGMIVDDPPSAKHSWTAEEDKWIIENAGTLYLEDGAEHFDTTMRTFRAHIQYLIKCGVIDSECSIINLRKGLGRHDFGNAGFGVFLDGSRKWVSCLVRGEEMASADISMKDDNCLA